jgi:hypothetical protein
MSVAAFTADGTKVLLSTTPNPADGNNLVGSTCVTDPISGAKQTVSQLHNADQQTVPGTANSSFSTGVAQLQDGVSGLVNRQREAGQDNVSPLGISSGAANFAMQFKTTCAQNLAAGVTTMTLAAVSGTIGGVSWSIRQGSKLVIDAGAAQETLSVASVNTATKVVTFTAVTANAHNGTTTPFIVVGMTFNQERDASGENDGASGAGTAIAAEYEYNGGDPSGGNFDRARSLNAKGFTTQTISAGGTAGSSSLTVTGNTGLQPGMKVLLYKASTFPAAGSFESVNVDLAYAAGSNTVPLASAIVNNPVYDTLAYDGFTALGPQSNGFLPFGVGIEAEALYDPVSAKMFAARMAPGSPGVLAVSSDGAKATYHYFSAGNTPAATPTDVLTITGSATKTVRIKKIVLSGLATTAGQYVWLIVRRSSANTGGTSTAPTPLKHDVNDPAATATLTLYTVNPGAIGTQIGTVRGGRLFHNVTTAQNDRLVFDFSTNQDKALILRGTSDIIAINGNSVALPAGATLDVEISWEEDSS